MIINIVIIPSHIFQNKFIINHLVVYDKYIFSQKTNYLSFNDVTFTLMNFTVHMLTDQISNNYFNELRERVMMSSNVMIRTRRQRFDVSLRTDINLSKN